MRKILFVLLGCGLLYGAFMLFRPSGRFHRYAIDKQYTIRFDFPQLARQEFTEREKADQDRDWIIYSLVAGAGLDKSQFAQITFDLAPVRYGFNSTTANFEYGDTRSKYLGDGQVIALVPAADDKTTNDNIAHILDEVRKNQGEIPHSVYLFEYALNAEGNFAHLTRRDNLNGKTFFTEKMGYFEKPVSATEELRSFMDTIDDITYAKEHNGTLVVGGRRLSKGSYGKATPEDVAAIWQSENDLASKALSRKNNSITLEAQYKYEMDQEWRDLTQKLELLHFDNGQALTDLGESEQKAIAEFVLSFVDDKTDLGGTNSNSTAYGTDRHLMRLVADYKKAVDAIKTTFRAKAQAMNLELGQEASPSASGFSLDPAVDCKRSLDFVRRNRPKFEDALQGGYTVDRVLEQLREGNGDIMQYAIARVANGTGGGGGFAQKAREECMYQRARYDGELQGTAAGMTLFYTDLLAKIWAANMFDSHPDVNITGFRDLEQTHMQTSVVFKKEVSTLPNCRLWFGPNKNGFQMGPGKEDILFARNATQIFALSHNNDSSDFKNGKFVNKEVQASKEFEVVLNWWNSHYEEVGSFEHQYQRLNEIMKWSTIIGWLNRDGHSTADGSLGFLDSIPVDHSQWFPVWAKTQKDLRFADLAKIDFYDSSALGNKTESLPLLISANRLFAGGVTLADKHMLEDAPELLGASKTLSRRANVTMDPLDPDALKTFKETKITFTEDAASNQELVNLEPKQGLKLRSRFGEVTNTNFELNISGDLNGTYTLENKIGGLPIGKLSIGSMDANGFTIGFEAGEVDKGLALSKEISDWQGDAALFFRSHPDISRAVSTAENQWCIQLKGSDKWIVMDIDADPTVNLPEGWTARVSGTDQTSRIVETKWVSQADAETLLQEKQIPPASPDPVGPDEQKIASLWEQAQIGGKQAAEDLKKTKEDLFNKAKEFETAEDYDQAAAISDKLLLYFGDDRELLQWKNRLELKAAIHSFETGNADIGIGYLNDLLASPVGPRGDEAFFKEVNNQIDHASFSPEVKKKVSNIAKLYFTDEQVAVAGRWEGYKPLAKEVAFDQALGRGRVKIIYADNQAFRDIDPEAPFETMIGQIRAIPGVKVYDISAEEIGRNTRVYASIDRDPGAAGSGATGGGGTGGESKFDRQIAQLRVRVHPGSIYNDCQNRDKNGNCEDKYSVNGHVYFVTAPSLN